MSGEPNSGAREWSGLADFYRNSTHGEFAQEHRSAGSFGVNQIRAEQPSSVLVTPPITEYVFARADTRVDVLIDLGDGPQQNRNTAIGGFNVVPPGTEARFQVSGPHELAIVSMPASTVEQLLDQASESVGPAANLWLDGLTLQLLAVMADQCGLSPIAQGSTDEVRIRRAIDYLETYLDTALTLGELARAASMDEVRFSQAFRATTGQAVWAYVEKRRHERSARLLEAITQALSPSSQIVSGDRRLIRVVEYIEAHLSMALTVEELARVATMSRSGFARAFRNAHGESVWSYVQGRRVARALELLKSSTMPIAQVAERCGFASQSHLTSVVRKRHGVTPGAVRRG